MKVLAAALFFLALPVGAQNAAVTAPEPDRWRALSFLEGSWEAKAQGESGVTASGSYTFQPELNNQILARHSRTSDCKEGVALDCEHGDRLYVFSDAPGQSLKAIYFDSEGHVIHYDVSSPDATTAVFLSDPAQPGPRFRLVYQLKDAVMSGKFQMQPPGQTEWRSYLEWSGAKK